MKKIEKIDRGKISITAWPERSFKIIVDKLDEIVDRLDEQEKENQRIWRAILALDKRVAEQTRVMNQLHSL